MNDRLLQSQIAVGILPATLKTIVKILVEVEVVVVGGREKGVASVEVC